ncbi:hypothetical protein [Carnobacterium maltaromaticum]|uniref:hypothetical protein n=1 Tax=Carnobacterium maltaromaticum TaxID=2751 RepID=UPI0007053C89|nr:hypothetical protein [Carnobacterium maltaromaticum]AOA04048.1 hypothetical protein BFC23_17010 [Carnobacterium maltaromaticum]MBC9810401.1 hypothetical protein [Carnobacterium maltaromaticum]GED49943.1 hypothetical protein CMA01_23530 [Carnobacterium maltaromaticum]
MVMINYKKKTHKEIFGKIITVEEISDIGFSFYLFDKTEFVYVGKGMVYSHEAGQILLTSIVDDIRNVRKNGLIVAKRKEIGRKLLAVKYVRKEKRKKAKTATH